jgi:hypothetical protein
MEACYGGTGVMERSWSCVLRCGAGERHQQGLPKWASPIWGKMGEPGVNPMLLPVLA